MKTKLEQPSPCPFCGRPVNLYQEKDGMWMVKTQQMLSLRRDVLRHRAKLHARRRPHDRRGNQVTFRTIGWPHLNKLQVAKLIRFLRGVKL